MEWLGYEHMGTGDNNHTVQLLSKVSQTQLWSVYDWYGVMRNTSYQDNSDEQRTNEECEKALLFYAYDYKAQVPIHNTASTQPVGTAYATAVLLPGNWCASIVAISSKDWMSQMLRGTYDDKADGDMVSTRTQLLK